MLRVAETIVRTDTGRRRSGNEDLALAAGPMFVIADGMGGAQSGEVASRIAIDAFESGLPAAGSPEQRLAAVVQRANGEINRRSQAEPEHMGMGTTLTSALLTGDEVAIAHVGDSRAYLVRDGELRQLTEDHSLVGELMREGRLTEQQAFEHPQRSMITRALGIEPTVEVDTWTYPLRDGDIVLLCSDGLTDMLLEQQVRRAIVESADLRSAADRLIDEANDAGGRDNITVVLFRVAAASEAEAGDQPTRITGPEALGVGSVPPSPDPDLDTRDGGVAATADGADADRTAAEAPVPVAPPPARGSVERAPLARRQGHRGRRRMPRGWVQTREPKREASRAGKLFAATVAVLVVVVLLGGGGYLASQQIYFLGTNAQGIVTVYQGLPYKLPFGIPMYSTFYTSGVPAQTLPAARRATLLNHTIRSQSSATKLVNDLELGKIAG